MWEVRWWGAVDEMGWESNGMGVEMWYGRMEVCYGRMEVCGVGGWMCVVWRCGGMRGWRCGVMGRVGCDGRMGWGVMGGWRCDVMRDGGVV